MGLVYIHIKKTDETKVLGLMTWPTANRIQSSQRLKDDIIKEHLAETLRLCTFCRFSLTIENKHLLFHKCRQERPP